jgi:hypothetical protein
MFCYRKKYMIYVFEGPRNSGKTFLSEHISELFNIPRFQFKFANFFSDLNLKSENSKEAHAFSLGKEFMLMQLAKDIPHESFIHDRGILTVLVWGLLEGRITEDEARNQIEILKKYSLLDEITIIYIDGENPDKSDRSKDQWDHIDGDIRERGTYEKVISMFQKAGLHKIWAFTNKFDDQSVSNIDSMFEDILFN